MVMCRWLWRLFWGNAIYNPIPSTYLRCRCFCEATDPSVKLHLFCLGLGACNWRDGRCQPQTLNLKLDPYITFGCPSAASENSTFADMAPRVIAKFLGIPKPQTLAACRWRIKTLNHKRPYRSKGLGSAQVSCPGFL